ncbi:TonB family protein [Granulicella aggregans]|uniref:TonB family protein n=1 Tax=Granulicella aggregans TaxID=474949 RepID=A0A7W7ZC40_9BACT|nr:energy transducer TonB [Granulicella aggregans]MBB5056651.1 TonB family protein [Granulicella aggregans]
MSKLMAWAAVAALLVCGPLGRCADKALTQRLLNAAQGSSLDDPALKPWHLKLTFQLYDKKGAAAEGGTIEEWWSAGDDKRIYTSRSYSSTDIRRDKDVYRTKSQLPAPYLLDRLRDEVVHPLAADAEINDSVPDLRVLTLGKTNLDCIMLDHPMTNVGYPPVGLFPTFCLDRDKDRLRDSYRYGLENSARNTIGTFQGKGIAVEIVVSQDRVIEAKAHVDTLAVFAPDAHFFEPDDSLETQDSKARPVSGGVIAGNIVSKIDPVYPEVDKQSHTQGQVHLNAEIGADGRIRQLSVIDAPSSTLAISALIAVRQWVYKPYLLNGRPCSVNTTVTVNYIPGPNRAYEFSQ